MAAGAPFDDEEADFVVLAFVPAAAVAFLVLVGAVGTAFGLGTILGTGLTLLITGTARSGKVRTFAESGVGVVVHCHSPLDGPAI